MSRLVIERPSSPPPPIQSITLNCMVDPRTESLRITPSSRELHIRATNTRTSSYVTVVVDYDDALALAEAIGDLVHQEKNA